uniref:Uncharacterized protein n=1 Tax=Phenylobacterium glaciei TaxID=2803784 RepID=A0A974P0N2_9CAUL|nr:hypothetical protein JKL49_16940 [Phenylobacterium glaciei]
MDATDLDAAFMMLCGPAARAIAGTLITIDDGQSLPGGDSEAWLTARHWR